MTSFILKAAWLSTLCYHNLRKLLFKWCYKKVYKTFYITNKHLLHWYLIQYCNTHVVTRVQQKKHEDIKLVTLCVTLNALMLWMLDVNIITNTIISQLTSAKLSPKESKEVYWTVKRLLHSSIMNLFFFW